MLAIQLRDWQILTVRRIFSRFGRWRVASLALALAMLGCAHADEIHKAAAKGDVERIRRAMVADAEIVTATDTQGKTLLHWAAEYGQPKVVKLLLDHKADVNARDDLAPLVGQYITLNLAMGFNLG